MKPTYITRLFEVVTPEEENCVAIARFDLFERCDEAMEFIARLKRGDFEEPQEEAALFLGKMGYGKTSETLIKK